MAMGEKVEIFIIFFIWILFELQKLQEFSGNILLFKAFTVVAIVCVSILLPVQNFLSDCNSKWNIWAIYRRGENMIVKQLKEDLWKISPSFDICFF